VYRWLPRLKKLFTELAVVDVLFNPVGHVDSYSKSRNLIDHVVVEHEGMAAWLVEHGERRSRISVIPNAVDCRTGSVRVCPGLAYRRGRGAKAPSLSGFSARLAEEKAPDTFVRIAARFKRRLLFSS